MSAAARRSIDLLRQGVSAPAPNDPAKRAELATIMAGMEAKYGEARYCKDGGKDCRDEVQLKTVLEESRNYDELLDAWKGWHDQARGLRPDYVRFTDLANEGARTLGYKDLGAMWRSGYDMPADDFTREAARLYQQVEPLYKDLQCYARGKLAAKRLDLIVANDITASDAGFSVDTNRVVLLTPARVPEPLELASKARISEMIMARVAAILES